MSAAAAILLAAADLVELYGWERGWNHDTRECCAVAAMDWVAPPGRSTRPAELRLARYLDLDVGDGRSGPVRVSIGRWNDAQPGPEPVLAALREAAEAVA
jgi:hypothetical protein